MAPRCPSTRSSARVPRLLAVGLVVLGTRAAAAETERAEIRFDGPTYQYVFVARLAAPVEQVHAVVTDFDGMARLNDDIIEARVLSRAADGTLERLLKLRHCILVFCFDMDFVERVRASPGRVETEMLADRSSFRDGVATWTIEALDAQHTRVTVEARQTPRFWIPPVLGPAILKRVFLQEVTESCVNIERFALAVKSDG